MSIRAGGVCGVRRRSTAGGCHRYLPWGLLFPQGLHGAHTASPWAPLSPCTPSPPHLHPQKLRIGKVPRGCPERPWPAHAHTGGPTTGLEAAWPRLCFPDLHQFTFRSSNLHGNEAAFVCSPEIRGGPCFPTPPTLGRLICGPKQGLALQSWSPRSLTFPKLDR